MADWAPLRQVLDGVEDQRTFKWQELDALVGGLPRSAYDYPAFWSGARTAWRGFTTSQVRVGHSVMFIRRSRVPVADSPPLQPEASSGARADVVLIRCVKSKRTVPVPAKELYTSALFRKERAYAEAAGVPWFILSAQHGLVRPDEVLEPYDLRLSTAPRPYQRAWGLQVVTALERAVGPLNGNTVELHAGAAYCDPIRSRLIAAGARVVEPLAGLKQGQRLAWFLERYPARDPAPPSSDRATESSLSVVAGELVVELRREANCQSPADFVAARDPLMRQPGLYSWWVDHDGAQELSEGLGLAVEPGLIYAGLAGATRSRSGKASTNTLWGRIQGMHLGGRHEFSTFRRSLGSILAAARGEDAIDEEGLTRWMRERLSLIAIPVVDADVLDNLETKVLAELDPALNLHKRPQTELRLRLSALRRHFE